MFLDTLALFCRNGLHEMIPTPNDIIHLLDLPFHEFEGFQDTLIFAVALPMAL